MDLKQLKVEVAALGSDHEYMSDTHYALFEKHLKARLTVLQNLQENEKQKYAEMDHSASDPIDKAAITEAEEDSLRRMDNIKSEIIRTRQALQAIQNDEFGFCKDCGAEIGLERLLSVPFSLRDVDCETLAEKKLSQNAGIQLGAVG